MYNEKEPSIPSKEPSIASKEPSIASKEPYIASKEPYIPSKDWYPSGAWYTESVNLSRTMFTYVIHAHHIRIVCV